MKKRRVVVLAGAGLLAIVSGVGLRLTATGELVRWRAAKMSDEALVRVAAGESASYVLVYEAARRQERNGYLTDAARTYARAAELRPTAAEAWTGWARASYASGAWKSAQAIAEKTVAQWPDRADARFLLAAIYGSCLRYHVAREQLWRALKLDSGQADAWYTLGNLAVKLDDPAEAVKALRRAVELDPDRPRGRALLGIALVRAGRHGEGRGELEAALRNDPSDLEARLYLGEALAATGSDDDRQKAIIEYNRVLQFSLDHKAAAHVAAARVWLAQGDKVNSTQSLQLAVDYDPLNVEALKLLVETYGRVETTPVLERTKRQLDRALALERQRKSVEAQIDAGVDLANNLIRLGQVCARQRAFGDARAAYAAALALEPANQVARRGAEEVEQLGKRPRSQGEPPEALPAG